MEQFISHEERIPVRGEYDLIVAGGGVAGVAAAVSAARMGKRVLLIEKSVSLGGLATIGLINMFVPMCNGRGVQVIRGMAEELLRLSISRGYDTLRPEWRDGEPGLDKTTVRYVTTFSVPIFVMQLTELVKEAGVDLLFDTVVSEPVTEGKRILGVIVDSKSGREYYAAKMFVDGTGDADLLYRAGVPTVQGGSYDIYVTYGTTLEKCEQAVAAQDIAKLQTPFYGSSVNLYGTGQPADKPLWTGTDNREITQYFVENHLTLLSKLSAEERKKRDIFIMPNMPQFRTTRRLDGDATFREEDAYRHYDDSIGAICDFTRRDLVFEVRYGTICRRDCPNVFGVGRIAAAEGFGWDILRVIPPAIITGQAAGVAAALAIDAGVDVGDVDIPTLQATLAAQDVIIHFDDAWVPADATTAETVDVGEV